MIRGLGFSDTENREESDVREGERGGEGEECRVVRPEDQAAKFHRLEKELERWVEENERMDARVAGD